MAETKNTLREAENQVVIEGLLVEKSFEDKEINSKDGKKEAITGEITVETAENEVHTISLFSFKTKADGTENGIAKGLETIKDEYKSVAAVGREEADKVRITAGSVGLNEYYGQDGKLKSFPQLKTNFVNRVKADEEHVPRAEFEVELFVKSISPEMRNDDETGRVKLEGLVPLYGGKIIPFTFVVNEDGSDYVDSTYEPGDTVKVYGDIINYKEKKEIEEEVAFGKPKKKITYKTVREYLVTGGSEPYEEENEKAYDNESIKKALTEREVFLDGLKKKKEEKEKGNSGGAKKGFNTKAKKEKKKSKVDDLPF